MGSHWCVWNTYLGLGWTKGVLCTDDDRWEISWCHSKNRTENSKMGPSHCFLPPGGRSCKDMHGRRLLSGLFWKEITHFQRDQPYELKYFVMGLYVYGGWKHYFAFQNYLKSVEDHKTEGPINLAVHRGINDARYYRGEMACLTYYDRFFQDIDLIPFTTLENKSFSRYHCDKKQNANRDRESCPILINRNCFSRVNAVKKLIICDRFSLIN